MSLLLKADVCHAYQILHRNGIPDERIVVMMYDDIANNEEYLIKISINHNVKMNSYEPFLIKEPISGSNN